MPNIDKQIFRTPKFLRLARYFALTQKDLAVPNNDGDLFVPQMWTLGVILALESMGYEIKKKD